MLALLAALALAPLPQESSSPPDAIERKGEHFTVLGHLENEGLADEALAVAEAAWPLALEALGLKKKKLPGPLVIHLYPDAASYEAAEEPLTGGRFKSSLAFSHFDTKTSHVALQPPCSPQALLDHGLPTLTAYLIAHEASHLVSYAYLSNALDYPEWFAEGMAIHCGLGALQSLGRIKEGLGEPLVSTYATRCKDLLRESELPEAGKILEAEIGGLDFYPRYSVNYRFYEFLLETNERDLKKTAKAITGQGGGEAYMAGLLAEQRKIWRDKTLEKLDSKWKAWIKAAEPEWDETFRSMESRGETWVQRGFSGTNAVAFRTTPVASLPFTATGTVKAIAGDAHQMNFLLGRTEYGFLSVAFNFGYGITVLQLDKRNPDPWTVLGTAECAGLRIGADIPFSIAATTQELVLSVAAEEVLRVALKGKSPLGPWGLGAQAGTTGEWKNVVVEAGP